MRRLASLFLVVLPCLAYTQDLQTARVLMQEALAELATHQLLTLELTGTETDGFQTHTFRGVLALGVSVQNARQVVQIELLDYRDNQLQSRIAADGERFWDYDLRSLTYTSTEYGTSAHAGKERERLFQNMLLRGKGPQTFLARLLKDVFGESLNAGASWLPWRPSATVTIDGASIVCSSLSPTANRLTYILKKVPGVGWHLNGAEYVEEAAISGRIRTVRWNVVIHRDAIPEGTSWQFVPPPGSRAISVSEARGGGL